MEGCGSKQPLQKKKKSSHLQEIDDISLFLTCLQQGICLWLCSGRNFLLFLSLFCLLHHKGKENSASLLLLCRGNILFALQIQDLLETMATFTKLWRAGRH